MFIWVLQVSVPLLSHLLCSPFLPLRYGRPGEGRYILERSRSPRTQECGTELKPEIPRRKPSPDRRPLCTYDVLYGVWAPAREQSFISVVSLLKWCFWKKIKPCERCFLGGERVVDGCDMDLGMRRPAGPTNQSSPDFMRKKCYMYLNRQHCPKDISVTDGWWSERPQWLMPQGCGSSSTPMPHFLLFATARLAQSQPHFNTAGLLTTPKV